MDISDICFLWLTCIFPNEINQYNMSDSLKCLLHLILSISWKNSQCISPSQYKVLTRWVCIRPLSITSSSRDFYQCFSRWIFLISYLTTLYLLRKRAFCEIWHFYENRSQVYFIIGKSTCYRTLSARGTCLGMAHVLQHMFKWISYQRVEPK